MTLGIRDRWLWWWSAMYRWSCGMWSVAALCSSGEEVINGSCVPCPRGYYKDNSVDRFAQCSICPTEFVTAGNGTISLSDCNISECLLIFLSFFFFFFLFFGGWGGGEVGCFLITLGLFLFYGHGSWIPRSSSSKRFKISFIISKGKIGTWLDISYVTVTLNKWSQNSSGVLRTPKTLRNLVSRPLAKMKDGIICFFWEVTAPAMRAAWAPANDAGSRQLKSVVTVNTLLHLQETAVLASTDRWPKIFTWKSLRQLTS